MRLATNKLKDVIGFYYSELAGLYEQGEIAALLDRSVAHYLGYSQSDIITKSGDNVNQSVLIKLYDCCKDLRRNIPLQYILGEAWFFELKFRVNQEVLIPRPETEELVSLILSENKMPLSYLDIGTGSGCIAVTIKKNSPASKVSACDISSAALAVARVNAIVHQVELEIFQADVLDLSAFAKMTDGRFDVIISNPPYIKHEEAGSLEKHVIQQEPHLALFVAGNDPVIFYKKIIELCKDRLNRKGKLYFELNPLTAEDVKTYAIQSGLFNEVNLIKDMSGKIRFLKATKI